MPSINLHIDNPNITFEGQPFNLVATLQGVSVPDGTLFSFQLWDGLAWQTFQTALSTGNVASLTTWAWSTSAKKFRAQCDLPWGLIVTSNTATITTPWNGGLPFCCTVCGVCFVTQAELDVHMLNVHPEPPPPPPNGCFIATACYGSPTHQTVCELRAVKDKLVARSRIAEVFYHLYYVFSPSVAVKVRNMQKTKRAIRTTIDLIWRLAKEKKE